MQPCAAVELRGAMYRQIPVGSKLCYQKELQKEDARMRRRIAEVKAGIDMRPPVSMQLQHLRQNMKREQLLEDRYIEIDRANRILLQKMSDIMRKPVYEIRHGVHGPVSVSKDTRKRELIRITQDNQALLRRIQTTQPVYRHLQWEEAYKRNELYLRNACEYPVVIRKQASAPVVSPAKKEEIDRLDKFLEEESGRSPVKSPAKSGQAQAPPPPPPPPE